MKNITFILTLSLAIVVNSNDAQSFGEESSDKIAVKSAKTSGAVKGMVNSDNEANSNDASNSKVERKGVAQTDAKTTVHGCELKSDAKIKPGQVSLLLDKSGSYTKIKSADPAAKITFINMCLGEVKDHKEQFTLRLANLLEENHTYSNEYLKVYLNNKNGEKAKDTYAKIAQVLGLSAKHLSFGKNYVQLGAFTISDVKKLVFISGNSDIITDLELKNIND